MSDIIGKSPGVRRRVSGGVGLAESPLADDITILLADDEPEILNVLAQHFRALGYSVFTADNGREAVEIARQECPDLVIMDVAMPEMDGMAALSQMNKLDKMPAVVMITAVADTRVFDAVRQGAYGYLLKPFHVRDLQTVVDSCLQRQHTEVMSV